MELLDKFKLFKNLITEQLQSFLRASRPEIDLVLVYSVTAAILFVVLRLQMLRRIVFVQDPGWRHLHGQLAGPGPHYYVRAAWVIFDYFQASWVILRDDMFYLAALTIPCLLISTLVSSAALRKGAIIVYFAIVFIALLFLSVNVELAPMYTTQLDYSLLKFSGLMTGITTTLIAVIPKSFLLGSALVCGSLLAAPFVSFFKFYQTNRRPIRRYYCAFVVCGLLAIIAVPMPVSIPGLDKLDNAERQNSFAYFLTSLVSGPRLPSSDLSTPEPGASASSNTIVLSNLNKPILADSLDNVLVIVLESVGAEYFELLNDEGLLPTISDLMSHGVYFKHAYASAPASVVSLVAILTSTGPLGNYKFVTSDYPRARLTTSYERFKSSGFVTAFFWSNESEFLGIDDFLPGRGIDLNQDYRHRICLDSRDLVPSSLSLSFQYSADVCTATSLLEWIDNNRGKRFLATLWTEQTHYPYQASHSCINAIAAKGELLHLERVRLNSDWPRYAAALCDTDRMMAKIVSGLRERKMLKNTLIIVVGDHGEAFGQHGGFAHGSEIFEEYVRVPLLISAGNSLAERVDGRLASHLDIAPTMAAAFGISPSDQWEGHDLFDNLAPRRVYFYSPAGNYKIGYREADNKYIYDVVRHKLSAFDLKSDPYETENIAGKDSRADAEAMSLISQWYLQRARFANTLH
jgi:lipoteichoic acid synthase